MNDDPLVESVRRYYTEKFLEHGATARGVDWNGEDSQELRFAQLMRIADGSDTYTITDYGCGYGALARYLERGRRPSRYVGFDVSEAMLEHSRRSLKDLPWCGFCSHDSELQRADFAVASGIFNVKLEHSGTEWTEYVLRTLDRLADLSTRGFAFNMLTTYSDPERMREDLFYGDPAFFFDRCKRRYAQNVALLHDYGLYEFTMLVRKEL